MDFTSKTFDSNTVLYAQWGTSATAPAAITLTDAAYTVGDTATALDGTATVTDGGTVTYQWYRNTSASNVGGTPITGETGATYTPGTATEGVFYYYVVATNINNAAAGTKSATTTSNTATITVQQTYTVTFVDWDDSVLKIQPGVLSGAAATAPSDPARSGYTFAGWDQGFNNVTSNLTVKATYKPLVPGERTYKVGHYQQDLVGDGYTLADTENLTAAENSVVNAVARSYTGFTEDTSNANRVASGTVNVNGDLVLRLYYNRNLCHVTL